MYRTGTFVIDGVSFKYEAKVFGIGSKFGIDDRCISKLQVMKKTDDGSWILVIQYDRNWKTKPRTKLDKKALNYILDLYK